MKYRVTYTVGAKKDLKNIFSANCNNKLNIER